MADKIDKYLCKKNNIDTVDKNLKNSNESEDGVMTYTTAHPRYRYGRNIKCPFCNKNIDLDKI